jgi:Flp pilus assembly protein TadG
MRMSHRMRSLRRNDRGAVAIIVAMLVGMGVLLGAAAISIDVGGLYAQRREVQNGADAAAGSLAMTCVKTRNCPASSALALSTLAAMNGKTTLGDATNQPSYAAGICAENLPIATTTDLPACNTPSGTLVDCPPMSSSLAGVSYVEAHTQTLVNGAHLLPSTVAKALGFPGANVQACARVAFGPPTPSPQNTMPIAMSYCDWKAAVGYVDAAHPGTFQNPPQGADPGYDTTTARPWPLAAAQISVLLAKDDSSTCTTWNGHTAPGGFSWLDNTDCAANVINGWVPGKTGMSGYCALDAYYKKMTFIPVFDCVADTIVNPIIPIGQPGATNCTTSAHGSGSTNYHIVGYAAFYLSGWHFSASNEKGSINPLAAAPCTEPAKCLIGWFTQALMDNVPPAPPTDTTPDFGPKVVLPAG